MSSLQQRARAAGRADVYLTPDVATVGFGGFARIREAVEIGYRATLEAFADGWPSTDAGILSR